MKNVLFICTANICRSPFAEKALTVLLADRNVETIEVRSAGTHAIPGYPPPDEAIRVAGEFGVDVSEHTSKPVSIEMINEADIIPVMSLCHKERILDMNPASEDKVVFRLYSD